MKKMLVLILILALSACASPGKSVTVHGDSGPNHGHHPAAAGSTVTTGLALPPVEGPDPSPRVAAFYYPWYGNLTVDGQWIHWDQVGFQPPKDISSDYMPALGAYSSNDPAVVAQHMAWLRQAGVGVIIVSWWDRVPVKQRPVPLILQMARRYGNQSNLP